MRVRPVAVVLQALRSDGGWPAGPRRAAARLLTGEYPSLAEKAASSSATSRLCRARPPRTAMAAMPVFASRTPLSAHRYVGSPAHLAVAAVAAWASSVAPASMLSCFRLSSAGLGDAPAQERGKNPARAGTEKRE
jgi:hypothetical protein